MNITEDNSRDPFATSISVSFLDRQPLREGAVMSSNAATILNNLTVSGLTMVPPINNANHIASNYIDGLTAAQTALRLDPQLPFLQMPRSVCDRLVEDLGLEYDPQTDLYIVPSASRALLRQRRPSMSIIMTSPYGDLISPPPGDGLNSRSLLVNLPYEAFEHEMTLSSGEKVHYFPIRRSKSDDFYLGRVLFQET
jgi:hypothetical protein